MSKGPENGYLKSLDIVFNIDIIIIAVIITYKSPNFIVVQVDQRAGVMSCFQGIHEELGNLLPKLHVVTASSPDPASATCRTDRLEHRSAPNCAVRCVGTEGRGQCVLGWSLTDAAVPGVVTAAALEVSQAAVPGEGVHHPGRADGVHKGGFPGS